MFSNQKCTADRGCLLIVVAGMVIGPTAATAQTTLLEHPVLKKYPSSQEIAEQVRQLRRNEPGVVEKILADFDLAIRSSLTLNPPAITDRPRPIVPRETTIGRVRSRASMLDWFERYQNDPQRAVLFDFYEAHFEELVFDDHPQAGLVMVFVLAFGWEDWSAWNAHNEKLMRAREKYPELHRLHALSLIEGLRDERAIGLLLLMTKDGGALARDHASLVALPTTMSVLRAMSNEDILHFYIDWAIDPATSYDKRWELWTEIQMASQRIRAQSGGRERAREFWEPYLTSDVPTLWYCAQKAWDRQFQEDLNWLSKAQSDWNYEHEPNPALRDLLGRKRDLAHRIAEINARQDPQTNRLTPEDAAALQELNAERKALEAEYKQVTEDRGKQTNQQPLPDSPE